MGFVCHRQTKKKVSCKETKFGGAQVLNIILRYWFSVNPNFQLLEFEGEDEDEDNSSTKPNPNVKCKGPVPSPQGRLFDLNSPSQMQ